MAASQVCSSLDKGASSSASLEGRRICWCIQAVPKASEDQGRGMGQGLMRTLAVTSIDAIIRSHYQTKRCCCNIQSRYPASHLLTLEPDPERPVAKGKNHKNLTNISALKFDFIFSFQTNASCAVCPRSTGECRGLSSRLPHAASFPG